MSGVEDDPDQNGQDKNDDTEIQVEAVEIVEGRNDQVAVHPTEDPQPSGNEFFQVGRRSVSGTGNGSARNRNEGGCPVQACSPGSDMEAVMFLIYRSWFLSV